MNRTQLKTLLYVDDDPDIREIVEMARNRRSVR